MIALAGKRCFVTGGHGYLGRALIQRLKLAGAEVTAPNSTEADLRTSESLNSFRNIRQDYVFHLAAWTQAGDFCLAHAGEQWLINQAINTTVLTWWKEYQSSALLVSIGTSCSYAPELKPVEENYLLGTPISDLYTYAMTKRMLHIGQKSLKKQFGLRFLTVVPSTLYGPGYEIGEKQPHFIIDLIRKILEYQQRGTEIVLWGDGLQRRELIHIGDFLDDLLTLLPQSERELINIGGGRDYSISELARKICDIVGVDAAKIRYDENRYVGARSKTLDIEKLSRLHPEFKRVPLQAGLDETIQWIRSSYFQFR